jgi:hypothetical protein
MASLSSVSEAWRIVSQSERLPITTATRGELPGDGAGVSAGRVMGASAGRVVGAGEVMRTLPEGAKPADVAWLSARRKYVVIFH